MRILLILSTILLTACHQSRLEQALRLAGENRKELEKVLQHYSVHEKDSLKLRAARFLIENMPGHYTKEDDILDSCRQLPLSFFEKKVLDICVGVYLSEVSATTEDVKVITADYLIRHIDSSFELLRYPWLKHIPFEWFLDYILPYRLEYETLNLWRDSLSLQSYLFQDPICDNHKFDASKISSSLRYPAISALLKKYSRQYLERDLTTECLYLYLKNEFYYRAAGLPVALDFLPCYPNRNGLHYWTTILSTSRKNAFVAGAPESVAAKVFRRTYSHNLSLSPGPDEYIPPFFLNPFNKDITDHYFYTSDITLNTPAEMPSGLRYGYLAVFNNLQWTPTAIGERKKNKITFKNMGRNILYLPVFYQGEEEMYAMDYPFALHGDESIQWFVPDTSHKITLNIYRKYPYNSRVDFSKYFPQMVVEGSDDATFRQKDTVAIMKFDNKKYCLDQKIDTHKTYRYLRLHGFNSRGIAEMYFWDKEGRELPVKTDSLALQCLDRQPLTAITKPLSKIIFDFGRPVNFSRIVCLPRGDGNGIYPEGVYELFYYERGGWKSLGQKIATDFSVSYSDVPSGALYWLRNLTEGVEERVFSYEHDQCRFW